MSLRTLFSARKEGESNFDFQVRLRMQQEKERKEEELREQKLEEEYKRVAELLKPLGYSIEPIPEDNNVKESDEARERRLEEGYKHVAKLLRPLGIFLEDDSLADTPTAANDPFKSLRTRINARR
jgi:hypothetical protein